MTIQKKKIYDAKPGLRKMLINKFDEKFYTSGKLDPCDCNNKSIELINRSIKTRKSFSSIKELKSNKKAKKHAQKHNNPTQTQKPK